MILIDPRYLCVQGEGDTLDEVWVAEEFSGDGYYICFLVADDLEVETGVSVIQ